MCLAIPLKVDRVQGDRGFVSSSSVQIEVGLDLVDDVNVGDYVIVHAGYAIQVLPAQLALENLEILRRMAVLDDHLPDPDPGPDGDGAER